MMHYNFGRVHKTLKTSPTMAAGVTDRLWDIADIVLLIEKAEAEAAPKQRGPYKKQFQTDSLPQVATGRGDALLHRFAGMPLQHGGIRIGASLGARAYGSGP